MYTRSLATHIQHLATKYPVVTLLGPRQSGKTTLVKEVFNKLPYVNLEDFENRSLASGDPKSFLLKYPSGAVFDEIQRVPELLSYIQVKVDQEEKKGMYILTGSHQVDLHSSINQSLAGRTSIVKLLPLSFLELRHNGIHISSNEIILKGGYPRIYKDDLPLDNAYSSYVETYVERDVRQIINIKDILLFEKFIKLLAARVGQVINYSSISLDVGVSATTIKEWVSVLEASYLIIRLQPYFENFGKRLIKSPKIYFTDTGLLCHFLGIQDIDSLKSDQLYGNIFENFAIIEMHKHYFNKAKDPKLYFFRDTNGNEIDLLIQKGSRLIPLEIKSSKTFSSSFFAGLNYFHTNAPDRAQSGYVLYQGDASQSIKNYALYNLEMIEDFFNTIDGKG